jgi:hypothetical protein
MKNLWILVLVVILSFTARATPLEDEIKSFTDAIKSSETSKSDVDPMMTARMPAMAAEFASSAMAPGGEANLEAMVKQMMATNPAEAVQKTGKALLAELAARKKARVDTLTAKVNEVLARVPDILIKAKKTQELDGILSDLQKVQAPLGGMGSYDRMYGNDPDSQAVMNRVNSAYQFVAQWQDYLSARNSGNIQEAQNSLRNLLNSRSAGDATLIPRSEILARSVELAGQIKGIPPDASSSASPAIDTTVVLNGIKTLDDIEPAVKSLKAANSYEFSRLAQMASLYAQARNGLPVSLDLPFDGNPAPELVRIKSMLFVYLLPRFIGNDALTLNPNETVGDYLKRSIEAVEAKQDWSSFLRIIEAEAKIAGTNGSSPGTHSFLVGVNQEMAGQYAQAVTAYQGALSQPDDYLPSKLIGDRLAAIKKNHPAEFDEGMKRFLTPPTPVSFSTYSYGMRPGMPGYPIAPGYPTPAVVPAAGPAPSVAPATATNAAPVTSAPPSASTNAAPTTPTSAPK